MADLINLDMSISDFVEPTNDTSMKITNIAKNLGEVKDDISVIMKILKKVNHRQIKYINDKKQRKRAAEEKVDLENKKKKVEEEESTPVPPIILGPIPNSELFRRDSILEFLIQKGLKLKILSATDPVVLCEIFCIMAAIQSRSEVVKAPHPVQHRDFPVNVAKATTATLRRRIKTISQSLYNTVIQKYPNNM